MTSPYFLTLGTNYNYDISIVDFDIKLGVYNIPFAEVTFVAKDIPIHDILAMLKRENQIDIIINGVYNISTIPIKAEILDDNVSVKLTLSGYIADLYRSNGYYVRDGTGYIDYTRLVDGEPVGIYAYSLMVDVLKHTHFGLRYAPAFDLNGNLYPESKIFVRGDWLTKPAWVYTVAANTFFSDNPDYDPDDINSPEFVTDMQDPTALVDCCNVIAHPDNTISIGVAGCTHVYRDGLPTNYWKKRIVDITDYITTTTETVFKFIDFDNAVVEGGSGSGSTRDTYLANPIDVDYLESFNADYDMTKMNFYGSGSVVEDYTDEKWTLSRSKNTHPNDPFLYLVSADSSSEQKEEFGEINGLWLRVEDGTTVSADVAAETSVLYDYYNDSNAEIENHIYNSAAYTGLFMGYDNPEYDPSLYPYVNGYFFALYREKKADQSFVYTVIPIEGVDKDRLQEALDMFNSSEYSKGVWKFIMSPTAIEGVDWVYNDNIVTANGDGTYTPYPRVPLGIKDYTICVEPATFPGNHAGIGGGDDHKIGINEGVAATFTPTELYQRIWHELLHCVGNGIESADNMNTSGVSGGFHTWLVANNLTDMWSVTDPDTLEHLQLWNRYLTTCVRDILTSDETTGFAVIKNITVDHPEGYADIIPEFVWKDDRRDKYNLDQVFNIKVTVSETEENMLRFDIEIRKRGSSTVLYSYTWYDIKDESNELYTEGSVGVFCCAKIVPEICAVDAQDSLPNPVIARFDNLSVVGRSETLFGDIDKPVIFAKNKTLNHGLQGKIVAKSILAQQNVDKEISVGVNPSTIYDMKLEPGMWVNIRSPAEIAGQHRIVSITITPDDITLNLNKDTLRYTEYIDGLKENINIIDSFSAVTN